MIPGAAPLRKVRWSDKPRGKGKRGGLRIVYVHIPDLQVLYMLDVYGKDEADDLTETERQSLRALGQELVRELGARRLRGEL